MSVDTLSPPTIRISDNAQKHFSQLLNKEAIEGMALRIFLDNPGSARAEVSIAFCPPGEHRGGDLPISYPGFTLYIDRASIQYLEEAEIDYKTDKIGGELAIVAPNLKIQAPSEGTLSDRVQYLLETEINPNLAHHGGKVSLVTITREQEVVLRFGGGCQGCGMVDVTLKQGIQKTLMEQLPEITGVIDATEHEEGENPYYT